VSPLMNDPLRKNSAPIIRGWYVKVPSGRLTGYSYLTGSVRVADDRGVICWPNISLLRSWLLMNPERRSSNSL
jgi:hypothetical protein